MVLLSAVNFTLPITDPILKFLLILIIILFAPLLLNKIRVPHLLGLIIAGAVIGPFGYNLMERDSGIILSGTAGLLYIMFLAGLDIDLTDFKKNKNKSIVFGMLTFLIPITLGFLTGHYILGFPILSSILLASVFASHTLLVYPIISKFGVAQNRAVNITVGGTMITDTLALLVLAVIVGMATGEVNNLFWIRMAVFTIIFAAIVVFVFPVVARWFFKRSQSSVSQYIFVLVIVFSGAFLAELAGIDGIIGAFLSGISLNRLIPKTSPLMNRIVFVGNAIFIPFFLIGVGMLVDYRAFFKDLDTLKVAAAMTILAIIAKYLAAFFTQKMYGFSVDERRLIFGLSNSHVAAALAIVTVGHGVILETAADGTVIRLLGDSVLNGTIILILISCTISSFVAQKGATNMALSKNTKAEVAEEDNNEKVLIPVSNTETVEELVNLSTLVKTKGIKDNLYALKVVDNNEFSGSTNEDAHKILTKAAGIAAATDNRLHELLRYDLSVVNGIVSTVKENKITDLILGLHEKTVLSKSFFGVLIEDILAKCNTTTLIYKPVQPLATIKRHLIIVPPKAEKEIGFPHWLIKVWNISHNTGTKLVFYAHPDTLSYIKKVNEEHPISCEFKEFAGWSDTINLHKEINSNDNLIIVLSRKDRPSYQNSMDKVPAYLDRFIKKNSFILTFPMQIGVSDIDAGDSVDLSNPSILDAVLKIDEIGKTVSNLFQKKF